MITIYPYENVIQYEENEKVQEFRLSKKAMKYGKIINIPRFEKELEELIKRENWKKRMKPKKFLLLLPIHYEEVDKELFTVLLNNAGIKKITYQKEQSRLPLKKNDTYINIHETYITLIEKKKTISKKMYSIDVFQSIYKTLDFIFTNQQGKTKYLLYGSNQNIPNIVNAYQKENLYFYNNYKTFIITKTKPNK